MERIFLDAIESHRPIIQEVIDRIAESMRPEKIICYGVRVNSQSLLSIFIPTEDASSSIKVDLLIILNNEDKGKRESFSDSIEKLSNDRLAIIPIVHSVDAVNSGLEMGNPFFVKVYQSGVLLYDNKTATLITPSGEINLKLKNSFNQASQRKFDLAKAFYETATDCLREGRFDVAALMLHQAVELTCISLLRTCIGYKPTTHSIRRLFLLVENITLNVNKIFPRSTESERQVFDILQRAYSDVRYKEEYNVDSDNIRVLLNRVGEFQNIALSLCQKKLSEKNIHHGRSLPARPSDEKLLVRYPLSSFDSIGLDTFSDVILHKGDSEGIQIESDLDITNIVVTKIEGNRLWITIKNDSFEVIPHSIIRLTYSNLNSIVVHHSGNVTCNEAIATEFLAVIQNGKGRVDLRVDVITLDATVTKTGTLAISGSALKANITNTGPGYFEGIDLEISEAKVTIKDSGGISIQVEDELNAVLDGDGDLQIKGEPRLKRFTMN